MTAARKQASAAAIHFAILFVAAAGGPGTKSIGQDPLDLHIVAETAPRDAIGDPSEAPNAPRVNTALRVICAGELFCGFDPGTYAKPIFYPVNWPGEVCATRHFPMREGVAGEADDHRHHKSLWFAHGNVNGVDFWSEKGVIKNQSVEVLTESGQRVALASHNVWLDGESAICNETARFSFAATRASRIIDAEFELRAETGPVVFGDTKEGTFAIRTHPALQLTNAVRAAKGLPLGQAINSDGITGPAVWGRRARWVYYTGEIDGQEVGLAILDHPTNLRHPTTWHARDYGLVAANPFGLHDFLNAAPGEGAVRLEIGQSLVLRYRVVLHGGSPDRDLVERLFEEFSRQHAKEN
jgi:hypothetical protein